MRNQKSKLSVTRQTKTPASGSVSIKGKKAAHPAILPDEFSLAQFPWKTVFEVLMEPIWLSDTEGRIQYANEAARQLFGEKITGRRCWELVHGSKWQVPDCPFAGTCQSRHRESTDFCVGDCWFHCTVDPLFDAAGKMTGGLHVLRDITKRKRTEQLLQEAKETWERRVVERTKELELANQSLRESEKRLRRFIESAPVAIAMFDQEMNYVATSRRWLSDYRLENREIMGRSHYEIFPEITERWKTYHQRGLAGEILEAEEDRFERADGSVQWVKWELRPWFHLGGAIGGIIICTEDITAHKRAEEEVKRERQLLRTLVDLLPDFIFVKDEEGRFLVVNEALAKAYGRTPAEMLARTDADFLPRELAARCRVGEEQVLAGNSVTALEDTICFPDGRTRTMLTNMAAFRDAQGRVCGVVGIGHDNTGRKRTEEALRLSEMKFARAFANNPAAIALTRLEDGLLLEVNDTWVTLSGFSREEAIGRSARIMSIWPTGEAAARFVRELKDRGVIRGWEQEFRKKSGETYVAELSAQLVSWDKEQVILSTLVDITARKRAEERIIKLNRVFAILSGVNRAIVHTPDQHKLLEAICRVTVEAGGFKLAWIGMLTPEGALQPVAKAGEAACLDHHHTNILARKLAGDGDPIMAAVRENRPVVIDDIKRSQPMPPGLERALESGLHFTAVFPIRLANKVAGVFQVYAARAGFFDEHETGVLAEVGDDISFALMAIDDNLKRQLAETALRDANEFKQQIITGAKEGILVYGKDLKLQVWNRFMEEITGVAASEVIGWKPWQMFPFLRRTGLMNCLSRVLAGQDVSALEFPFPRQKSGRSGWASHSHSSLRNARGEIIGAIGIVHDVTERKRSEQLLQQANRTLQAIRDCHEAMLRANTEPALLEEVCRIIVHSGGERMAWVGFADKGPGKTVEPVAAAGVSRRYLEAVKVTWADTRRGCGPVGTAIRTGQASLCHNTLTDPYFAPWREGARRFGYGSVIALPLKADNECFGALAIYAAEPDAFDVAEQLLLTDLANDLAFGINTLRLRAERERLEGEILKSIEREQERIGRDLHDGVCQLLVGAKFRSAYLKKLAKGNRAGIEEEAGTLDTVLGQAIEQTRDLARGLNPVNVTPAGLGDALEKLAVTVTASRGPHCFCRFPKPVNISDHHTAFHLYRIAQEAVQNALKHAAARNISLTLTREDHHVLLIIKDDGGGFSPRRKSTGMGLKNMQMRARLMGGRLEIRRRQHGGTEVKCEIPRSVERPS